MKRSHVALLVIGVVLLVHGAAVTNCLGEAPPCTGKYKGYLKPTDAELREILKQHRDWLKHGGWGNSKLANDLARANLCETNLQYVHLSQVDLSYADLSHAGLQSADLSHSNLEHANLSGANCSGADLRGAYLVGADLRGADLSQARLNGAELSGAHLKGAFGYRAYLGSVNLSHADLSHANLRGAFLNRAYLYNTDLSHADLRGADLRDARLRGADLRGVHLSPLIISPPGVSIDADLRGADLSDADLSDADLRGAILKSAHLNGAQVSNAKLDYANLTDAFYAPVSEPPDLYVAGITGLATIDAASGEEIGLIQLRKLLEDAGLRDKAREATFSIQRNITKDQLSSKFLSPAWIAGILRTVGLEWTTAYGLHPERSLLWILLLGALVTPLYMVAIRRPTAESGIMRIFPAGRLEGTAGEPADEQKVKKQLVQAQRWRDALRTAAYFSLISAVNIGFEQFTPGDWIRRLQTRVYSLEAVGWVRVIAGVQALLSVYLLAMWVLTQFGQPFE